MTPAELKSLAEAGKAVSDVVGGWIDRWLKRRDMRRDDLKRIEELETELKALKEKEKTT